MEAPSHPSDRILRESYISPSQETILEAIPGWDTGNLNESFTPSQPMPCSSADEMQSLRLHVLGDNDSEDEFYDGEINFPKQEPVEWGSPPETQGKLGDSYDSAFESGRSQSPLNREGSSPPFALLRDLISSQYYTQSGMEQSQKNSGGLEVTEGTHTLKRKTTSNVAESQSLTAQRMEQSQKKFGGLEVTKGTRTLKRKTRVESKSRTALQQMTMEEDPRQDTSDGEVDRGTTAVRQKTGVEGEIEVHSPPQEAALQDTREKTAPNKSCEAETVLNSSGNKQPAGNSEAAEILIISRQVSPRVLTDHSGHGRKIQDGAANIVRPFHEMQSCRNDPNFSKGETGQGVRRDPRNFPKSVMDVVMFHSGSLPPSSPNDPSLLSLVMKAGVDLPLPFDRNYMRHERKCRP